MRSAQEPAKLLCPTRPAAFRDAAKQCDEQTFSQQLANNAAPAGAQSHTHSNLVTADSGASKQEVRDVRTRDQQHRNDRNSNTNNGLRTSLTYSSVSERTSILKMSGSLRANVSSDAAHNGLRVLDGRSRFQARQHREDQAAAAFLRKLARRKSHRHPETNVWIDLFNTRGSDANDLIAVAVELNRAIEGGRV